MAEAKNDTGSIAKAKFTQAERAADQKVWDHFAGMALCGIALHTPANPMNHALSAQKVADAMMGVRAERAERIAKEAE